MFKNIMKLISALILMIGYLYVSFYSTQQIYDAIGMQPPEFFKQVITTMFGLLLLSLTFFLVNHFGDISGKYMNEIFEAIKKISRGDFDVKVINKFMDNKSLNELVENINNMALNLNNMEKIRQEFISNVSHEIQSPLTSIRGFAQVLKDDKLNYDERLHYLNIIESESIRLSKLSDNLLKLTSLENENVDLNFNPYRLDKQIRNVILMCEPQWSGKDIDIEVYIDEAAIIADEELLRQVWINLINNSIKFTPQNGKIQIHLHDEEERIRFSISDTGIGMSEESRIHIFERFYKADKSRDRNKEGNGLGLSIVKKIINLHKGKIEVMSQLGEGSTFIVYLPKDINIIN